MSGDFNAHCSRVCKALAEGRVVPFLGAGSNLCGRPTEISWRPDQREYLPHGGELADYLAEEFGYPPGAARDLSRVSQYAAVMEGTGPLYEKLRKLLDHDHPPTDLHSFFAQLTTALYAKGYLVSEDPRRRRLVLVSTNYDDLLERAFRKEGMPFHLITYEAEGEHRGKFFHWRHDGGVEPVERPNSYDGLMRDRHPVILKVHGTVDRSAGERDSFVITEDHYIDYLTRTDISTLLPGPIPAILRRSHLLFLGYGLRDWNLRVILHRIWGSQRLKYQSWAVQLAPDELDYKFWLSKGVEILDKDLTHYVSALATHLESLKPAGGVA